MEMEIGGNTRQIRKYIAYKLLIAERRADAHYVKFNPFHKWRIGKLVETEIQEALDLIIAKAVIDKSEFFQNKNLINKNTDTIKTFELLSKLEKIYVDLGYKYPSQINWNLMRGKYDELLKKENEASFINYSKSFDNHPNATGTQIDSKNTFTIEYQIENFFKKNFKTFGDFRFGFGNVENPDYLYRFGVANLAITISQWKDDIIPQLNFFLSAIPNVLNFSVNMSEINGSPVLVCLFNEG